MRKAITTFMIIFGFILQVFAEESAISILKAVDENMLSSTSKASTTMIIHTRRGSRTISSINYSQGNDRFFSEYTAPVREKGTKMLKLKNSLWIYEPSSDRTIQISQNMMRQSVMGSDLSYEDFMETLSLLDIYNAEIEKEIVYDKRDCYELKLTAKKEGVNYPIRKQVIDKEWKVVLYEELFSKTGKQLKTIHSSGIKKIDGRWYPSKMVFKDVLKEGSGTEFLIDKIEFDVILSESIFSKANLRK